MSLYEVAIATRNPKTLYLTIELLENLGIHFVIRAPDDIEDGLAGVIMTTLADTSKLSHIVESKIMLIEDTMDPDETTIRLMFDLLDISLPSLCVVGVDPGMRFGIALVENGQRLHSKTCSTPHEAVRSTLRWSLFISRIYPDCSIVTRIGTGSRLYEVLYLRGLRDTDYPFFVELVDERNTTVRGKSDQSSAVIIASRRGRRSVESDYHLDVKDGYIRSLVQLVSRISDGRLSLTKDEARSVLLDNVTLEALLSEKS